MKTEEVGNLIKFHDRETSIKTNILHMPQFHMYFYWFHGKFHENLCLCSLCIHIKNHML